MNSGIHRRTVGTDSGSRLLNGALTGFCAAFVFVEAGSGDGTRIGKAILTLS